jgi:hypothetical protein
LNGALFFYRRTCQKWPKSGFLGQPRAVGLFRWRHACARPPVLKFVDNFKNIVARKWLGHDANVGRQANGRTARADNYCGPGTVIQDRLGKSYPIAFGAEIYIGDHDGRAVVQHSRFGVGGIASLIDRETMFSELVANVHPDQDFIFYDQSDPAHYLQASKL